MCRTNARLRSHTDVTDLESKIKDPPANILRSLQNGVTQLLARGFLPGQAGVCAVNNTIRVRRLVHGDE